MRKKLNNPQSNPTARTDVEGLAGEALRRQDRPEAITVTIAPGVVAALGSTPIEIARALFGFDDAPPVGWERHFEIVTSAGEVVPLASRIGADGRPAFEPGDALVRRIGSSTTPADVAPVFADRPLGRGRIE